MSLQELFNSSWGPWLILFIGAMAGAVVFYVGQILMARKSDWDDENYHEGEEGSSKLDPFLQGGYKERRGSLRRSGNPVSVLLSDADAEAKPVRGYVLDRSTGGLCISTEIEVEAGTILSVRTSNAPETVPWWQIEVRNCRDTGKDFELGCQWLRTPPWSVLLLFG